MYISVSVSDASVIEEAGEESGRVVKVFIAMSENREAAIVETLGENLEVDVHPHLEGLNNDDELGGMRDYRVEPRDQTPFLDGKMHCCESKTTRTAGIQVQYFNILHTSFL